MMGGGPDCVLPWTSAAMERFSDTSTKRGCTLPAFFLF
jgi:hypothetical protein